MQRYSILAVLPFILFFGFLGFSQFQTQENIPPKVTIVAPMDKSSFNWNSIIPYTIHIVDDEDGNSEYDEINPTEVLLVVKYLKDSSQIKPYLIQESKTDYGPLVQMGSSTCFSCHRAKGTLIGPSFERIANKYPKEQGTIEALAKKVIQGSTSVWSDEKMPPHPDLKMVQVQTMISWILENNSKPDKNYLAGIEGTIKTMERPKSDAEKGVLVLTAGYTDHGSNNQGLNSKHASTTIVLNSN